MFVLADNGLLVVLDNFEHMMGAAPLVADLLGACPGLKVLATSRQPLRLRAERELQVAPLVLPNLDRFPPIDELARIPAVELFIQRAESANRTFALTEPGIRQCGRGGSDPTRRAAAGNRVGGGVGEDLAAPRSARSFGTAAAASDWWGTRPPRCGSRLCAQRSTGASTS